MFGDYDIKMGKCGNKSFPYPNVSEKVLHAASGQFNTSQENVKCEEYVGNDTTDTCRPKILILI